MSGNQPRLSSETKDALWKLAENYNLYKIMSNTPSMLHAADQKFGHETMNVFRTIDADPHVRDYMKELYEQKVLYDSMPHLLPENPHALNAHQADLWLHALTNVTQGGLLGAAGQVAALKLFPNDLQKQVDFGDFCKALGGAVGKGIGMAATKQTNKDITGQLSKDPRDKMGAFGPKGPHTSPMDRLKVVGKAADKNALSPKEILKAHADGKLDGITTFPRASEKISAGKSLKAVDPEKDAKTLDKAPGAKGKLSDEKSLGAGAKAGIHAKEHVTQKDVDHGAVDFDPGHDH